MISVERNLVSVDKKLKTKTLSSGLFFLNSSFGKFPWGRNYIQDKKAKITKLTRIVMHPWWKKIATFKHYFPKTKFKPALFTGGFIVYCWEFHQINPFFLDVISFQSFISLFFFAPYILVAVPYSTRLHYSIFHILYNSYKLWVVDYAMLYYATCQTRWNRKNFNSHLCE